MNCNAVCPRASVSTRFTERADENAYLSEAVHSTVIANPNDLLASIEAIVMVCDTGWIVNDHRGSTALDYVDGDVVSPGECQDLWLPAPDPSITDGAAVYLELFRCHETSICGADPVFTVYGG